MDRAGLHQHVNIENLTNQTESMNTVLGHTSYGIPYKCKRKPASPNSFAVKLLQTVGIYHKMAC